MSTSCEWIEDNLTSTTSLEQIATQEPKTKSMTIDIRCKKETF